MAVIDHRVDAVARSVLARHQAGTRGGTVWRTGIGLFEDQAFFGERIDIWGGRQFASNKTHISPAHVINQNENKIRPVGCEKRKREQKQ